MSERDAPVSGRRTTFVLVRNLAEEPSKHDGIAHPYISYQGIARPIVRQMAEALVRDQRRFALEPLAIERARELARQIVAAAGGISPFLPHEDAMLLLPSIVQTLDE